ncbi:MAG: acyl-CoA/acyl-ACP dehydrogenase [Rhodospirillaceae bacterium]|jgi:acyl-CoA dehydrogenase|nr:acyl-CoA/acyl-ACP dehydrogenase [Rhodospirillaceae bacterium]MBT3808683.1 acyl-CoA/acyl-ACP dehydrogenase [Rhodospirillaceae bacterium]MBT3929338.1 acyl-CoA/acyl-ACP dehydrogenase [Rhodospirillaceae bacterium]MBT4772375.1 acyl-CoA/acyl-ACP dehydrogenase [Rhodospirillaceae bacterium]MBT5359629.1 acyl-CoA/acyl-ACP dehydrogenase [Rhodospirillaceae bacterium]
MEFQLTEEQLHWRAIARDFTEQVIKPDVLRRDRLPTAEERIPWDWIRAADALGLRTLGVSKEFGGVGVDIATMCIVGEELGVGDLGFAVIMDQCWKTAHLFADAMTPEQQQRFIPPFVADPEATTAIGITEEGVGSDHQGYYDSPDIELHMSAVRDGDDYVLNGTKRYISNGSMARLYFIIARIDKTKTLSEGGAVFVIPHDTPGFRAGFFHEKSSQRLATNGTFHLEDCRVPVTNLMIGEGMLGELRGKYLPGSKSEAAATVLGVGRAAYEYALDYAKQRVQGGKPIIEHQAVALMLGRMAMSLDAARLQIWKAAWLADRGHPDARVHGLLAKVNASEAAFETCRLAAEVLGGAGIMHEHPVEKYLRDAASFLHSDGTNQLCLLRAVRAISSQDGAELYGF